MHLFFLMVYDVSVVQCPVVALICLTNVCVRARRVPPFFPGRPFGRSMINPTRGSAGREAQKARSELAGRLFSVQFDIDIDARLWWWRSPTIPLSCHQTVNISIDSVVIR